MNIHCNTGIASTNRFGYFEGFGTVWYHKEGITNILSLDKVQEDYHVAYDIQDGNTFLEVKQIKRHTNSGCQIRGYTTWKKRPRTALI